MKFIPIVSFATSLKCAMIEHTEIDLEPASSSQSTTQPSTSSDIDAFPTVPSIFLSSDDILYMSHINSTEYRQYVAGLIKPNYEFETLSNRLLAPLILEFMDDESLEDDVELRLSAETASAHASMPDDYLASSEAHADVPRITISLTEDVLENTTRAVQVLEPRVIIIPSPRPRRPARFDIPEGDFILTIGPRIREIRLALKGIQSPERIQAASVRVNYALFLLHMDVARESTCSTQDCSDTREIIAQIHYRMIRLFKEGPSTALTDLLDELHILKEALKGLWIGTMWMSDIFAGRCCRTADQYESDRIEVSNIATTPLPQVTIQVRRGCFSSCLRRTTTTTTSTTTTTTVSSTPNPAEIDRRNRLSFFLTEASNDLDDLLFQIGLTSSLNQSSLAPAIGSLRVNFVTKFLSINRGIVVYAPPEYNMAQLQIILTQINNSCGATEWPELRDELLQSISAFRKELYKLRAANV